MIRKIITGPVGVLLNLSFVAAFSLISGAIYLKCPIDITLIITFAMITFSIYGLNRYTDKEDLINKPNNHSYFKNNTILFALSLVFMIISSLTLIATNKFTIFHLLILFVGVAYSFKIIPLFNFKDKKIVFTRIKDIFFAKSAVVSLIWGSSYFLINLSVYKLENINLFEIIILLISCVLSIFINTNFADIRDVTGDAACKVPTIPVKIGVKNTYFYMFLLPSIIWFILNTAMYINDVVSPLCYAVILCNLIFPAVYIGMYYHKRVSNKIVEPLSDTCILYFGIGLIVLGIYS